MNIPDSVFDNVIKEMPVGATNIEIVVAYSWSVGSLGTHKGSIRRFFPSKAEATFKREVAKTEDAIKQFNKQLEQAIGLVRGIEERTHKRLTKLEKKNDPDTTGRADSAVAS
jgi:hypothetical protein